MIKMEVDLIIIEGMGRAIHTNLMAKFKTDSLKLAVIKVIISLKNRINNQVK
jgi:hypothetical protein